MSLEIEVSKGNNNNRFVNITADLNKEKLDEDNNLKIQENFKIKVRKNYQNLFKITRTNFDFFINHQSNLELLPVLNDQSGDIERLDGWLETTPKDVIEYVARRYAKIDLKPRSTPEGIIYYFNGLISWINESYNYGNPHPVSCIPVYDLTGIMIDLKSSIFRDSSLLFGEGKVKIEYQSLDFKVKR